MSEIETIENEALGAVAAASDLAALDAVRVAELGKKGRISGLMKTLGSMSPEERQTMGPALNGLRNRVQEAVEARKAELQDQLVAATEEKNRLIAAADSTAKRLNLASRLVNGLKDENERWGAGVEAAQAASQSTWSDP
mgnify:CR=1 FL=1